MMHELAALLHNFDSTTRYCIPMVPGSFATTASCADRPYSTRGGRYQRLLGDWQQIHQCFIVL